MFSCICILLAVLSQTKIGSTYYLSRVLARHYYPDKTFYCSNLNIHALSVSHILAQVKINSGEYRAWSVNTFKQNLTLCVFVNGDKKFSYVPRNNSSETLTGVFRANVRYISEC